MGRMVSFGRGEYSGPSDVPNAIVGAARRINIDRRDEIQTIKLRSTDLRQRQAWHYFDAISEIKSGYNYYASVASRVRLHAGWQSHDMETPSPIGVVGGLDRDLVIAARAELSKLSRGRGGQPNLIRNLVLNLLVTGEAYLVGANGTYSIRSTSELKFDAEDRIRLVTSRHGKQVGQYLADNAFVARIWRTHPEFSEDPDSPMYGLLGDCSDLLLTARLIRASVRSRLNAGLLYVADELRFQRSSDPTGEGIDPDVDPFEEELTLALTDPIGDSDSPSEIMPLVIRGPHELKDGIVPIDLGRTFDPALLERYTQLASRVLQGLEIPPDLVTSMKGVRYTNVQSIMEDFLKAYIEPMMVLVCEALTTVYLRPKLIARGFDEDQVDQITVWYDPSEIVTHPDRSDDADKGYDKMLVSGKAWRDAHGFSESDRPTTTEMVERVGLTGQVPPENMLEIMRAVAPQFIQQVEQLTGKKFEAPVAPAGGGRADVQNPGTSPGPAAGHAHDPAPPVPGPVQGPTPPTAPAPEGGLPPRKAALAVDSERLDPASFIQAVAELSARQQGGPSKVVRDRERRLRHGLEAERRLRDSLSIQLEQVVQRALDQAGANTVNKVRQDSELSQLALTAALDEVYSMVPDNRRAEFGINEEHTIREIIGGAKDVFFSTIKRYQNQGWKSLGDEVFESQKKNQATFMERAWTWLADQLATLAAKLLNKPDKTQAYVPMDIIRTAQTMAGGGDIHDPRESGRAVLSIRALGATGWEFGDSYRWIHGATENPFEPHVRLDDVVFNDWRSSELSADQNAWPYVTHYRPGDHSGCTCDWLPELAEPAGGSQ